jgi:hypothetical protein
MANIYRTDGKSCWIEMTPTDWSKTSQDFKSEPGKPKSALMLLRGGTCSVPVRIVEKQNLLRRALKRRMNAYGDWLEVGAVVEIQIQRDCEADVKAIDLDKFGRRPTFYVPIEELEETPV